MEGKYFNVSQTSAFQLLSISNAPDEYLKKRSTSENPACFNKSVISRFLYFLRWNLNIFGDILCSGNANLFNNLNLDRYIVLP